MNNPIASANNASAPTEFFSASNLAPFTKAELDRPFRYYFRRNPRVFIIGITALFFTNTFDILSPLALKICIESLEAKDSAKLIHGVLLYCALMLSTAFFRFTWRFFFGRFHHAVAEDLRNRIFYKLTQLGPSYFQKTPVGQLMSLITSDVNTFRQAIGPATLILFDAGFYTVLIVPVMISLSWDWTWKTFLVLPFVPIFIRKMENLVHARYRVQQDRLADVSARAQEIVSGVRPIKSFSQ